MCLPLLNGLPTLDASILSKVKVRLLNLIDLQQHLFLLDPYASQMATEPMGAHLQVIPHPRYRSLTLHSARCFSLLTCASTTLCTCGSLSVQLLSGQSGAAPPPFSSHRHQLP